MQRILQQRPANSDDVHSMMTIEAPILRGKERIDEQFRHFLQTGILRISLIAGTQLRYFFILRVKDRR
ncbi:hypothetical protein D1872_318840 [compost metagenome]